MAKYKQIEWNAQNLAKFWDYTSQFPELYFTHQFGDLLIKKLKKFLSKKQKVLDYGCGTGDLVPYLLNLGLEVTGLDFSVHSINSVNKRFHGKQNFHGAFKIEDLLKKGEKFDVILLMEVIEHLDDFYLKQTMENIKNLLAYGGIVIFTTPNDENLAESEIFCPECEKVFHRWQHVRSWTKENLCLYLKNHGFSVFKAYTTDFSASFKRNKINYVKHFVKKFTGNKNPHLVCAAQINSQT